MASLEDLLGVHELRSLEATAGFATRFSEVLQKGDVVFLQGGLGAGKTTFAATLARALGVTDTVISPTYVLAREYYSGAIPLLHIDAYRLVTAGIGDDTLEQELEITGLRDFQEIGVSLIEWGEQIVDKFPRRYELKFEEGADTQSRVLEVKAY